MIFRIRLTALPQTRQSKYTNPCPSDRPLPLPIPVEPPVPFSGPTVYPPVRRAVSCDGGSGDGARDEDDVFWDEGRLSVDEEVMWSESAERHLGVSDLASQLDRDCGESDWDVSDATHAS